jgi:hypothetical protein
MNTRILLASLYLAAAASAPGGLYNFSSTYTTGFPNSGNIVDGSTSPWSDTRTVGGITASAIQSVSVRLTISGGYNGDLYGYLSYDGVLVPLLNRVGVGTGNAFGYSGAGLSVKFTDTAANNIHFYQSVIGFSISDEAPWMPDGRTVNPVTAGPSTFDTPGTVTFSAFSDRSPNGQWTLVLADVSKGGGQAQVVSWGLDITAVPEPVMTALAVFGVGCGLVRWLCRRAES